MMLEVAGMIRSRIKSFAEEIANSITHGIGFGLSIFGLVMLLVLASSKGDVWRIVSFSIYGSSLVLLYAASTFYHSFQQKKVKSIFRIIDHSAIYILIAGTYTPFALVTLRGIWGWTILGIIWGLGLMGITYKIIFKTRYEILSTTFYLLMGWLAVVAFGPLLQRLPAGGVIWLIIGGLFYSLGVIFFAIRKIPFNHTIWHLFVLGGSISHYIAMLFYVLPD